MVPPIPPRDRRIDETKAAGEFAPPNKALTGLAAPERSVCALTALLSPVYRDGFRSLLSRAEQLQKGTRCLHGLPLTTSGQMNHQRSSPMCGRVVTGRTR